MAHSMFLIVTGGALMPRTQEPSHGAGQTRPVNSGKLLVLCRRSSASLPQAAIDQVVPLGDEVVDRAARGHAVEQRAGVAERHAAIHAAGALLAELLLAPCAGGTRSSRAMRSSGGAVQRQLAQIFDEAGGFSHACRDRCTSQLPPTRARSRAFSSNAAMMASLAGQALARARASSDCEHALVILRHHLDELRHHLLPVRQQPRRRARSAV